MLIVQEGRHRIYGRAGFPEPDGNVVTYADKARDVFENV